MIDKKCYELYHIALEQSEQKKRKTKKGEKGKERIKVKRQVSIKENPALQNTYFESPQFLKIVISMGFLKLHNQDRNQSSFMAAAAGNC